jgi:FixJ family two-component response regulator
MAAATPVYVVDDDHGILESTQFLLEMLGLKAETFSDPVAFLHKVRDLAPGCVLTDFSMPAMSGMDLKRELHARGIRWPVLLMSAHFNHESSRHLLDQGVFEFLEKPFTVERLSEVLNGAFKILDKGRTAG